MNRSLVIYNKISCVNIITKQKKKLYRERFT